MEQTGIVESNSEVIGSVGFYVFTFLKNIYWKCRSMPEEWNISIIITI
jgi:hypothetical protein